MPGRHCPYGLAAGFAARRVIAEWMEFYEERCPHSALGRRAPAEACCVAAGYRYLIAEGGRDGLTTGGYPLTCPLYRLTDRDHLRRRRRRDPKGAT